MLKLRESSKNRMAFKIHRTAARASLGSLEGIPVPISFLISISHFIGHGSP
jgi:hypothetical protein